MQETQVQSLGQKRFPGGGNGIWLQSSCLRNPTDRGAWWATVHGVTKELDMTERLYSDNSLLISVCEFISVNELGYLKLAIHMLSFILKITCCFSVTKLCWLFATPWTVACQAPPSSSFFQSLLKFMSNNVAVSYTDLTLHTVVYCYLLSVFTHIMVFCSCSWSH